MKLLSLFGLDALIRRVRIAAGEGALAAEDRAQLVGIAWEEEKQRLKLMLVLVMAVLGLTTVVVALLSVAMVVHFWDSPHRVTVAWSVAAVWVALWLAAIVALINAVRNPPPGVAAVRREFGRDWAWARERFGLEPDDEQTPDDERPTPTREELLARIGRQRLRVETLQQASVKTAAAPATASAAGVAPPDESATAAALRIARAHPVATGVAAAAAVVVLKPRRLLRLAVFVAPILWRMR